MKESNKNIEDAGLKNSPSDPLASSKSVGAAEKSKLNAPSSSLHPFARKIKNLFSPMSIKDQALVDFWLMPIIGSALLISFPVAYVYENVLISVISLFVAWIACMFAFLPNWRQSKDDDMNWVSATEYYAYYQLLLKSREKLGKKGEEKPNELDEDRKIASEAPRDDSTTSTKEESKKEILVVPEKAEKQDKKKKKKK